MKKLSIVAEMINSKSIEILDENDFPVIICPKSPYKFINKFQNPSILIDNTERGKYKDFDVRTIDLNYLSKFGYRLVSVKCTPQIRNFPMQSQSYILEANTKPIPNSIILNKIPKEHFIEYDISNNRIRIIGKNVFPYLRSINSTPWIQVIKK